MFLDSNIIIEGLKSNPKALKILIKLSKLSIRLYINSVVISEVVYQLHSKRGCDLKQLKHHLLSFSILETNEKTINLMFDLIGKYRLKPNDALILATCKQFNIFRLIYLDSDFKEACQKEKVNLIDSAEKLEEV